MYYTPRTATCGYVSAHTSSLPLSSFFPPLASLFVPSSHVPLALAAHASLWGKRYPQSGAFSVTIQDSLSLLFLLGLLSFFLGSGFHSCPLLLRPQRLSLCPQHLSLCSQSIPLSLSQLHPGLDVLAKD